jgi:tetratricopeptide (TPR) repeat protein
LIKIFIVWFLITSSSAVIADDFKARELLLQNEEVTIENIEIWRSIGYSYKENDELAKAIAAYQRVISFDEEDYDARLALARLYLSNQQLDLAYQYFQLILENDITDVEAYLGLARTENSRENYSESITFYYSVLKYLPEYFPALFELANVYIFSDKLDDAVFTYNRILEIDNSWSEAWSGIGKIYWWQDKPFLALQYYKKALELDPENKEITAEYENVKNAVGWNVSIKYFGQSELEEDYEVSSFNQHYSVAKRITDKFSVSTKSFWQYAQKDQNEFITERYYDTSFLKSSYKFLPNNEINFTIGGSISDSTLTTIDAGWSAKFNWKNFKIFNDVNFGNEYFYHWEMVRRSYLVNNLKIKWINTQFVSAYKIGQIPDNTISLKSWQGKDSSSKYNNFLKYDLGINYQVLDFPIVKIGGNYRFMDYQYESSLYYSPLDRKIWGLNGSLYVPWETVFLYLGGSVNRDNYQELEADFDSEFGVNRRRASVSIGFSNFKNQYYESKSLFVMITGNF